MFNFLFGLFNFVSNILRIITIAIELTTAVNKVLDKHGIQNI